MLPQTHSESLAVQLASREVGEGAGKTRRENEEREREEHAKEVEELRGEVFALNAKVKHLLTSCCTLTFVCYSHKFHTLFSCECIARTASSSHSRSLSHAHTHSQLRKLESLRQQLSQGGEVPPLTREEQGVLRKEIQEQEVLLQGYQKVHVVVEGVRMGGWEDGGRKEGWTDMQTERRSDGNGLVRCNL